MYKDYCEALESIYEKIKYYDDYMTEFAKMKQIQ